MSSKARKKSVRIRFVAIGVILALMVAFSVGYTVHQNATSDDKGVTIVKMGVDGDSYNDIWDAVNAVLEKENAGVKVELVKMDGEQLNSATDKKDVDLNAFQHRAYLDEQIESAGYNLVPYANTLIQPLNVYSDHIKSLDELKPGDTIVVPENPTNLGRSLKVLEAAGVLKTDPDKGYLPTVTDITENPKNIKIVTADSSAVARVLPDNTAGIINASNAVDAGLNPAKDSIYSVKINAEDIYNKPWINIIAGRKGEQNNPAYRKVVEAYGDKSVEQVFEKNHQADSVYVYKNLLDEKE